MSNPTSSNGRKKTKPYKDGTRCIMANKQMYSEKLAKVRAERFKPDERGEWQAYKCEYGGKHWHIGHKS